MFKIFIEDLLSGLKEFFLVSFPGFLTVLSAAFVFTLIAVGVPTGIFYLLNNFLLQDWSFNIYLINTFISPTDDGLALLRLSYLEAFVFLLASIVFFGIYISIKDYLKSLKIRANLKSVDRKQGE